MKPPMPQTCTIVSWQRNIYGDLVNSGSSGVEIPCRWRQIIEINPETHREEITSNAMVWANPDATINIGDILLFENLYYRVTEKIQARKLDSATVQFLKLKVEKFKTTANVS